MWTVSIVAIAVLCLLLYFRLVLTETVHRSPKYYQTRNRELLNKKYVFTINFLIDRPVCLVLCGVSLLTLLSVICTGRIFRELSG